MAKTGARTLRKITRRRGTERMTIEKGRTARIGRSTVPATVRIVTGNSA